MQSSINANSSRGTATSAIWKTIRPELEIFIIEDANHGNIMYKPKFKDALKRLLDEHSEGKYCGSSQIDHRFGVPGYVQR